MALFELVIALLFGAALLTMLARRFGLPYPTVLAVAGAALAVLPTGKAPVTLDPELALALFVAPVLLDAGFDTSLRDLRANWAPVMSLVLFCVVVTVAAVALVARALVPDMPWAVAIALGAIVAPPDATAATAVLRLVSPPHRMLVILEGESLLNDASALTIYRLAVLAATGTSLGTWTVAPTLVMSAGGGCLLGYGLGRALPWMFRRFDDIPVHIVTQFVSTFAAWIFADAIGASPVLTVVVYAMTLARSTALEQDAENRRHSFAVWDVATYALNALAYILMGLQLHTIIRRTGGEGAFYLGFSLLVLLTVIVTRFGWVLLYNRGLALHRHVRRRRGVADDGPEPTLATAAAVSWCGMRGIITLATALALPGADVFPHRDLVVTAAFTVVLGTLLLQGTTLKPLMGWLGLHDEGEVGREERLARRAGAEAALRMLKGRHEAEAEPLRHEFQVRLEELTADATLSAATLASLRMDAIATERRVIAKLRRNRTIGDAAYHTIEEELDLAEGHAAGRRRGGIDDNPDDPPEAKG